jgi:hypothetical protein
MLMIPYNVMCSSVGTVLCIVLLFAPQPTEFVAENKRNVEQETPKDARAVGRVLVTVGADVSIELSCGSVVKYWLTITDENKPDLYLKTQFVPRSKHTPTVWAERRISEG